MLLGLNIGIYIAVGVIRHLYVSKEEFWIILFAQVYRIFS